MKMQKNNAEIETMAIGKIAVGHPSSRIKQQTKATVLRFIFIMVRFFYFN